MDNDNLDSLFEDALKNDEPEQESAETPADDDGKQAETAQPPKPPQDSAERARQAEGRRIREREQRAYQAARAEVSETLRRLGIENPDDGTTIDSVDALEAYEKALSDRRINSGNANADDVRRIVQEEQQAQTKSAAPKRELEMIRDLDPNMKDLGAILNSDIGPAFRQYVNEGASFTQAYGRAVRERNARMEGASASSAAKAAGKGHMAATSQRGEGGLTVPADELKLFRELNPGVSDKDIREYYNKDRKKYG